ncbi:MAG: hypothetical protein R3240_00520 [Gammaproteobacteria bacterium]|nr:hypothetical protein [Gammaproteobacteria bacterium]
MTRNNSIKFKLLLLLIATSISQICFADVIGMSSSTMKFGWATGLGSHNMESRDGSTKKIDSVQPYNLIVTDWLNNGLSYWVEAYYASYRFSPTEVNLGQQVTQYGTRASLLYNFYLLKYLQPWVGVGLDTAYSQFSKRHTIDFEGYLAKQFSDENKWDIGYLVHAHNAWNYSKNLSLGIKAEYRIPFSDSIKSSTLGFFILYRPR